MLNASHGKSPAGSGGQPPTPDPDCFVSIVSPLYNDEDIVADFVSEVMAMLAAHYSNHELVLVDDGSTDMTVTHVRELLTRHENIRLLRLSRHFGEEVAISAGLDSVIGDYCVVMLAPSDPPDVVPSMVRRSRDGVGVVYGIRSNREGESRLYRFSVGIFYWVCQRLAGIPIPTNSTHLRVLSRQAVNAITQIQDRGRYLTTLSAYVGFEEQGFVYQPLARRATPRRKSIPEAVNLAITIIVSNSIHPLRIAAWLGFGLAAANVGYMALVLMVYLAKASSPEGWSTMSMVNATMFSVVLLILAVIAEYLGRSIGEQRGRPLYYVREELNSEVLVSGVRRKNVVTEGRSAS